MDPYSISDFAEEAQRIVLLHEKSELILERLPPLLLRLASGRTWFDPKMLQPTLANGAGVYPLFDAPGPGLSVRAVSLRAVATSQSVTLVSEEPDASVVPSGLKLTLHTAPVSPVRVCSFRPVAACHTITVSSREPEASMSPSGLKLTL